jgi:calcineurin-like phosphoesterase family protein
MNYFTADWHLGDPRIGIDGKPNLFYRPFKSIHEQNQTIIDSFRKSDFKDGDTLWHLGDVIYDFSDSFYLESLRNEYPNSKFNLIVGNYDENHLEVLSNYFDNIYTNQTILIGNSYVYLDHYPVNCKKQFCPDDPYNDIYSFAITGHIHGLWKVQPKMINVGVDAWHFRPVSEPEILFCWNAMQKFYDQNVFPNV